MAGYPPGYPVTLWKWQLQFRLRKLSSKNWLKTKRWWTWRTYNGVDSPYLFVCGSRITARPFQPQVIKSLKRRVDFVLASETSPSILHRQQWTCMVEYTTSNYTQESFVWATQRLNHYIKRTIYKFCCKEIKRIYWPSQRQGKDKTN